VRWHVALGPAARQRLPIEGGSAQHARTPGEHAMAFQEDFGAGVGMPCRFGFTRRRPPGRLSSRRDRGRMRCRRPRFASRRHRR
jgi:hypothetical protein